MWPVTAPPRRARPIPQPPPRGGRLPTGTPAARVWRPVLYEVRPQATRLLFCCQVARPQACPVSTCLDVPAPTRPTRFAASSGLRRPLSPRNVPSPYGLYGEKSRSSELADANASNQRRAWVVGVGPGLRVLMPWVRSRPPRHFTDRQHLRGDLVDDRVRFRLLNAVKKTMPDRRTEFL